ncbi:tyrosyl-DNA phosphodiesterase-domain-containing protein [Schizothecium vesticola]|uniref:Tyrosyl-DNA phosphodiesterase-domain-containing protein n=1 Tax=Schizothecium vesticola TaxID=314040 RepID=A0AA40ERK2_9PEZI|nr:tyrosyl-DNA phosphodiesterase-domain-containing protein [Schizothecium vesticola]
MDRKRAHLADDNDENGGPSDKSTSTPRTLTHPISPPSKKRRLPDQPASDDKGKAKAVPDEAHHEAPAKTQHEAPSSPPKAPEKRRSPFQLTRIRDLPPELNKDTVTLPDLIGDPLLSECWEFNYLHSIPFLLSALDPDVRPLVKIHIIHGFWKRDDPRRLALAADAAPHPNITLHTAYLPVPFGTHHTKMLILFRRDATAQVVIHTANLIPHDWTNMTNAVWCSPRLPLLSSPETLPPNPLPGTPAAFQTTLLSYLSSYPRSVHTPLTASLRSYSFAPIRAHLIASVPTPSPPHSPSPVPFGWPSLPPVLRTIPTSPGIPATIALQISSIATLGPTDIWLRQILFPALAPSDHARVKWKVIFPTPEEIRASLAGYASGTSIHTKTQSAQQGKQLGYLRGMFCRWDGGGGRDAGRGRAAPHVKTYVRYAAAEEGKGEGGPRVEWALLTSANLSKQAWGEGRNKEGRVRVASYEMGVLVWPGLWGEGKVMEGVFGRDEVEGEGEGVVPLRMAYGWPLKGYEEGDMPWVATKAYDEVDWMGRAWEGWGG